MSLSPPEYIRLTGAAGPAALVGLIYRYLAGFLDPYITLLEIHKLMYFMQAAGESLHLRYRKAPYGPYADNLRHVLHAIEGHLISGYADGGDDPHKQIDLVPGAIEDARRFLEAHPATRERFDRVTRLIDGFESPTGLELLSTVHWVATNENVNTLEDVIARSHAWGERKRQFTERQIGLAANVLAKQGWIDNLREFYPRCPDDERVQPLVAQIG